MGNDWDRFDCMIEVFLEKEFKTALDIWQNGKTPYNARSLVRAFFSGLEAMLNGWAHTLLNSKEAEDGTLSTEEIVLLKEETYRLDDKGEVCKMDNWAKTPRKVRFLFRSCAKAMKVDFELNVSEWSDFKKALRVRDRVTHPHSPEDIEVSEDEVELVRRTFDWFMGEFMRLLKLKAGGASPR